MRFLILALLLFVGCAKSQHQDGAAYDDLILLHETQGTYTQVKDNKNIFYNDLFWIRVQKNSIYSADEINQSPFFHIAGESRCNASSSFLEQVLPLETLKNLTVKALLPPIN